MHARPPHLRIRDAACELSDFSEGRQNKEKKIRALTLSQREGTERLRVNNEARDTRLASAIIRDTTSPVWKKKPRDYVAYFLSNEPRTLSSGRSISTLRGLLRRLVRRFHAVQK